MLATLSACACVIVPSETSPDSASLIRAARSWGLGGAGGAGGWAGLEADGAGLSLVAAFARAGATTTPVASPPSPTAEARAMVPKRFFTKLSFSPGSGAAAVGTTVGIVPATALSRT